MSFDCGDFGSDVDEDAEGIDAQECDTFGAEGLAGDGAAFGGGEEVELAAELEVADAGQTQELTTQAIEAGRMEGMQPCNQILAVFPTDTEALDTAERTIDEVGDYTREHGFGSGPEVDDIEVRVWDASPEFASYSSRTVSMGNFTENVNIASAAHEGMHGASFLSEYSEVNPATGNMEHHDICGIDEIVTVKDGSGMELGSYRDNELLNEGMTVSYTREMLSEAGHEAAAATDECLSYDIAADIAGELRGEFPELVDGAYFNGELESLRNAVDEAAGRPGTFDEISALLDRVGDEGLALEARVESYDRAYELLTSIKR